MRTRKLLFGASFSSASLKNFCLKGVKLRERITFSRAFNTPIIWHEFFSEISMKTLRTVGLDFTITSSKYPVLCTE